MLEVYELPHSRNSIFALRSFPLQLCPKLPSSDYRNGPNITVYSVLANSFCYKVKEERNFVQRTKRRKANWIA